jgi:HK97 family phage major capsid protein
MEKMLNSAMVEERMTEVAERRNQIVDEINEKKEEFENSDTEKREELLNEVEELTKEADSLEEENKDLEEQRSTFKAQEERMSLAKNLEKTAIEERKSQMENTTNVLESKEYNQLYADMIRGKVDEKEVRSFLVKRDDPTAGLSTATPNVPIPVIMQGFVETAWYEYGKFSRLVSETFEPAILKIPVETSATGASWHTEGGDAPNEETITLGQIILQPKMIKKWISLTDELMAMSAEDFLRYVSDELVYRVILALDEAIINRTDVNGEGVIGIAGNANTESVSAPISFNVINEAISNLVTFDDLVVAVNPETFFKNFMGLTDQVGNPIFRVVHDNENRPQYYLSGYRVEFTQALSAYDSADPAEVYAIIGNFRRGYRLNYPQGRNVITLVDPYTLATQDLVRMIGRLYVAGNVVKPKHFVELKVPASV